MTKSTKKLSGYIVVYKGTELKYCVVVKGKNQQQPVVSGLTADQANKYAWDNRFKA